MDYFLTEDQKNIQKIARKIAEEKVMPVRAELDETGEFPWAIMKSCAETGLFGVSIPEEYGGLGGGSFENCIVVEELSKACLVCIG
jgi:butyryl-CoA dehydrogenase